MKTYNIAAIPGDGIGTEVIAAGSRSARRRWPARRERSPCNFDHFDWGCDYYKTHGAHDAGGRAASRCSDHDAILFRLGRRIPTFPTTSRCGACASPSASRFDQYANVRPTRILPGITSPLRHVGPDPSSTG